jgi:NitT/TauT family transport system substrate-binding protein
VGYMKKLLSVLIALSLVILGAQAVFANEDVQVVRVASLKGPTSMGLVKLMQDDADVGAYDFTVAGSADELVPLIAKGELDIALIPCNLASVLWNKTEGGLSVAAVNTLGVLYVVEAGDTVSSIADLAGKTLYSTGKGTTPEYALSHVLKLNGIDPAKDLSIEYKSEATEVAAALSSGTVSLAMLPQPYVTAVLAQQPELRVALSLTDEWASADPSSQLVTGVVAVRSAFAQENPELLAAFMEKYAASTAYVNENPEEAGVWIEELGIAKAAIAAKAIPACNIVCITGDEMKAAISGYLGALYEADPVSVGGALPGDAFYLPAA